MKFKSIKFSHQVKEDSRSSWLQTLGNQLIDPFPYTLDMLTTNITYRRTFLEYVNVSQVNTHVVYMQEYITFVTN